MRKKISDAVLDFLPIIPTLLTVLVAASAVAFGRLFSLNIDTKISILLSTVALLATSDLIVRHRELRELSKKIYKTCELMETNIRGEVSADIFFQDGVPVEKYLRNATDISIVSTTLLRFMTQFEHLLQLRLQEGAKVRIVLLNDGDDALKIASLRSGETVETWKSQLTATHSILRHIKRQLPTASLEIRTIEYPIAYGITILNAKRQDGRIVVQIWPHLSTHTSTKPFFILTRQKDPKWFAFYQNQFELTWTHAQPLTI
jgi:hypothetical protein